LNLYPNYTNLTNQTNLNEEKNNFLNKNYNEVLISKEKFIFINPNNLNGLKIKIPNFDSIDVSNIDIILISNFMNLLSLPFITENENYKFSGKIYATEPTIRLGNYFFPFFFFEYNLKLN
jgi:hypothetical protein